MRDRSNAVWIAVRVQRGFVTSALAFTGKQAALACENRWRAVANPDYDESAVFRSLVRIGSAPALRR
jgi:hypothetical protein